MPTINQKIADSLLALREAGADRSPVLRSSALSRTHRERLVRNGYLAEIMPGWVMVVDPTRRPGSSTPYYANFWRFLSAYLNERFGADWVADANASLRLHAGERTVPPQVVVVSPRANNLPQPLPFGTSLYALRGEVAGADVLDGMRVLPLGEALVRAPANVFTTNRAVVMAALASLGTASEVTGPLLRGGHSVVAGRLAGAFRAIGRVNVADEILRSMKAGGHRLTEMNDPLDGVPEALVSRRRRSPVAVRIAAMWADMRGDVASSFDDGPTPVTDERAYLADVDDRYTTDAYHSLSIEGYSVTPELIEKVRSGAWSPETSKEDGDQRNALAAKGYSDCFRSVRQAVSDVLDGAGPAEVVVDRHMDWFRTLFQPSVNAGLFMPERLAGYRQHFIYLDGSRYVPVAHASVQDAMDAFCECLEQESDARVRAVLGHFLFTFIHPLPDGNGRIGRFILNIGLASGGYPWTVIPVDERARYMISLDSASLEGDIKPFASLVNELVRREPPPPRRRAKGEEPEYREAAPTIGMR